MNPSTELIVTREGSVALIEMCRPPHNFVDMDFLRGLADTLGELDADEDCRAVVLCSGLRSFSAGADFGGIGDGGEPYDPSPIYAQAMRLFRNKKPIVAAVEGPSIGAGLGLALAADFRIASSAARFSAAFARLGFHPGFGLSVTLPRVIGEQKAALLLYTGRRIDGEEALTIGLVDELVPVGTARDRALALAQEIAVSAPLAVESIRATLRLGLAERVTAANQRELALQLVQFRTTDFREGIAAAAERRQPVFRRR